MTDQNDALATALEALDALKRDNADLTRLNALKDELIWGTRVSALHEATYAAEQRTKKAEAELASVTNEANHTLAALNRARAELAALRASRGPQEATAQAWQPIPTGEPEDRYSTVAPWDGKDVLIWCDHGQYVAAYDNRIHGGTIRGWSVDDNKHGPYALRGSYPTHWMLLPAPPVAASGKEAQ